MEQMAVMLERFQRAYVRQAAALAVRRMPARSGESMTFRRSMWWAA